MTLQIELFWLFGELLLLPVTATALLRFAVKKYIKGNKTKEVQVMTQIGHFKSTKATYVVKNAWRNNLCPTYRRKMKMTLIIMDDKTYMDYAINQRYLQNKFDLFTSINTFYNSRWRCMNHNYYKNGKVWAKDSVIGRLPITYQN